MFSFLDNSLYGDAAPQAPEAPQGAPRPTQESAPRVGLKQAASPLRQDELNVAMGYLQARIAGAEKRTALMEQRLLNALQEQRHEQRQEQRQEVQGGCSWPLFFLAVFLSFCLSLFFSRASVPRSAPTFPALHHCSPVLLSGALPAAPGTFLRGA